MRSSACKYILDKVSKFEKKYAKPIQKINKTNDDDFLSSKENSSSEHLVSNIKFIKSNTTPHSKVSKGHKERHNELGPLESRTRNDLERQSLSKSLKDTYKTNKKGRIHVIEKNSATGSPDASSRYECDEDLKKSDKMFLSDINESLSADNLNFSYSFENVNQSTGLQFLKDYHDSAEHSLKDDLKSGEKKVTSSGPNALLAVDNEEQVIKKGRLHVNLNLKLDEDPEEVSDLSSKGIASLSLESSISSKNVPIRVFTFEDLIGAEDLKSVSEELKGDCEEKIQLNVQTSRADDNFVKAGMLIPDNFQRNSKSDENSYGTSRNSSEESLQELIANVDGSSIEEDIQETIESSSSDKINCVSEQIHSSSETKTKVKENALKSEFSESNGENMFRVDQCNDNHSSDESIQNFMDDDRRHISVQKNKSDVNHDENSENESIKYKPREFTVMKNLSVQDLNTSSDKPIWPRKAVFKYAEKSYKRKKYLENEWKLMKKSNNVLHGAARNAYTQTENFLAEAYDFDKRMDTIMKRSLTSMAQVNLEVSNVHSEHTSHPASAPSPLEQGFNCALKQQVELTKHFICAEYNMYAVCMAAIKEMSSSYKPATLHYSRKMRGSLSSKKASR